MLSSISNILFGCKSLDLQLNKQNYLNDNLRNKHNKQASQDFSIKIFIVRLAVLVNAYILKINLKNRIITHSDF